METLKVTRKKKGNWFTNMIKADSTLPDQNADCASSENDDPNRALDEQDSDSDHGFFDKSVYH